MVIIIAEGTPSLGKNGDPGFKIKIPDLFNSTYLWICPNIAMSQAKDSAFSINPAKE